MSTYIVHLFFRNSLHAGASTAGVGIEAGQNFLHSDTIWAAICNIWAQLGSVQGISFEEFIGTFTSGSPLFRMSSAFPFGRNGSLYLLPRPSSVPFPLSREWLEQGNEGDLRAEQIRAAKEIKKSAFISLDTFKAWIRYEDFSIDNDENRILVNAVRPQASIDRLTIRSSLYHNSEAYFENRDKNEVGGLYFLLSIEDQKAFEVLKEVFGVIFEVSGFGGNVQTGQGRLVKAPVVREANGEWENIFNDECEGTDACCLLSLYYPDNEEVESLNNGTGLIGYELVPRKGWTGSLSTSAQVKRKSVFMFKEGSVFSKHVKGKLAVVTPDDFERTPLWKGKHPVYRYGYAFSIPMNMASSS